MTHYRRNDKNSALGKCRADQQSSAGKVEAMTETLTIIAFFAACAVANRSAVKFEVALWAWRNKRLIAIAQAQGREIEVV
jgi:hypothetical protein